MRVRFRLNQMLARYHQSGHGLITRIKNATSIERHKVSRLLDDQEDKISLKHLGELCRFLIETCNVDPRELPGALFELEPSHFLALLRSTPTLRTCFGVRQRNESMLSAPWTSGTDSFLHGKLLELLLRPEPVRSPLEEDPPRDTGKSGRDRGGLSRTRPLQIRHFHQEQVYAASSLRLDNPDERDDEFELLRQDARRVYDVLHERVGGPQSNEPQQEVGHVSILLGTIKSNPACELATARTFCAVPWGEHGKPAHAIEGGASPELVKTPTERAVPFFIRYRDRDNSSFLDPCIPSCHAGMRLAQGKVKCGEDSSVPGIYYETPSGRWECAPWTPEDRDAALVLFDYDRLLGDVEVVMGGFSSRATLLLADRLEQIADFLLPEPLASNRPGTSAFITERRAVGAFVIEFRLAPATDPDSEQLPVLAQAPTIIALDEKVLARRLPPRRS